MHTREEDDISIRMADMRVAVPREGVGHVMVEGEGEVHAVARVAAVEQRGEAHATRQRTHQQLKELVVGDHACLREVHRADGLVEAVLLVAMRIGLLAAVATEVKKERVARRRARHEPPHAADHVRTRGSRVTTALLIGQHQHAVGLWTETLLAREEGMHFAHVVAASIQLATGTRVVDADEESAPSVL